jgi:transposase
MFTGRQDMEATALREQGWTISAIARHLGRDRRTIRAYLNGERVAGVRKRSAEDAFCEFIPYLRARFGDDKHLWASALFDEVVALGFPLSYQSFTRGLRRHELRPHCEACDGVKGRSTIEIDHPAGEEIQWDWLELPDAPWGNDAHLLVGSLPCSGKFRGVFSEAEDQAHLIEAIDGVLRRLGGTAKEWRTDRMATMVDPKTGVVQPSFVPVAKHYGVVVRACPPRRGNRKGSVEKSIHFATQRFWKTMTGETMPDAQRLLDRFCQRIGDRRPRALARLEAMVGEQEAARLLARWDKKRPSVGDLASLEPLRPLPAAPFPATISAINTVNRFCRVPFEGNLYSVPTGLVGHEVVVTHRLGTSGIEIRSRSGVLLSSHARHIPGAGYVVRDPDHQRALEHEVLAAFTTASPCKKKQNRPPGESARQEAKRILSAYEDKEVVVSLDAYQALVDDMTAGGSR